MTFPPKRLRLPGLNAGALLCVSPRVYLMSTFLGDLSLKRVIVLQEGDVKRTRYIFMRIDLDVANGAYEVHYCKGTAPNAD